ncbi:MAG: hypothetical protein QXT76_03240 [Sulfolobales archaeon]
MLAVAEFSGLCRGNPVRISRDLETVSGRIVSYDPGMGVVIGTFKVDILDVRDLENKKKLFMEHILKDVSDCRLWVKIVLSSELCARFRKISTIRLSSRTSEALIVKLKNYVYALWCRSGARTARLTVLSDVASWRPGELTEIVCSCEKMPKLFDDIREDLMMVVEGTQETAWNRRTSKAS